MKFGTSGLRGLVSDMSDEACAAYVRAFLAHLDRTGPPVESVLIGRDLRPSSPQIAEACAATVVAAGREAVDCGALPTPALALAAQSRGVPAIMVTGSHIPFDRNGLKFYKASGEIEKADEDSVIDALGSPAPDRQGGVGSVDRDAAAAYVERLVAFLPPQALKAWRIGVYQHSAVGRDLLVAALESLGAMAIPLGRSDVFVPIDTEAVGRDDLVLARGWVEEHSLDAVVSTDGDGDRPLIFDERGAVLRGDVVGVLTARALGCDAVATPVTSSTALEHVGWFGRIARTKVGSPFVIAGMTKLADAGAQRPCAYEANGGFLLGAAVSGQAGRESLCPLATRDALTPICVVLAAAAARGVPLSSLAADLPQRHTTSDRATDTPSAASAALVARLVADPAVRGAFCAEVGAGAGDQIRDVTVDATDGARLIFANGEIVHLRPSGNAPELRCYAEAESPTRAAVLVAAALAAALRRIDGAALQGQ